jgi:hypothetical protein
MNRPLLVVSLHEQRGCRRTKSEKQIGEVPLGIGGNSGQPFEKEINGGNPAVPSNDEIGPGISWRLTRAARYPSDPPAIAQFLGLGNWLILKVRVSRLDRACDAIDLLAAVVDTPGLVEHAICGEDLVNGRAPTRGVIFTEHIVKIAGQ